MFVLRRRKQVAGLLQCFDQSRVRFGIVVGMPIRRDAQTFKLCAVELACRDRVAARLVHRVQHFQSVLQTRIEVLFAMSGRSVNQPRAAFHRDVIRQNEGRSTVKRRRVRLIQRVTENQPREFRARHGLDNVVISEARRRHCRFDQRHGDKIITRRCFAAMGMDNGIFPLPGAPQWQRSRG